ncbi:MAG: hypothetical protein ABFR05_09845 [Bacteroidota bacterium]
MLLLKKKYTNSITLIIIFLFSTAVIGQTKTEIPKVLHGFYTDKDGEMFTYAADSTVLTISEDLTKNILSTYEDKAAGTNEGIYFDFNDKDLNGTLYFGLIHYADGKYPLPVYRSKSSKITEGKTLVNFKYLRGNYDMTGWEDSKKGTIGYRIINDRGNFIYDGKVSFSGNGPFNIVNTLKSGPFINLLKPDGATISFVTSDVSVCEVNIDQKVFKDKEATKDHEIIIDGLKPDTTYNYSVKYGDLTQNYTFKTSPLPGSRKKFVFAYTSDSRAGAGGGERSFNGTNAYIMKKIMAVAAQYNVAFAQVTGDMINGYRNSAGEMLLQYRNFKNAIEPFGHHFPIVFNMGNHESYNKNFTDKNHKYRLRIDNFPYATNSSETLFASIVTNPHNGPNSEDGSKYDPDKTTLDFPPYEENVFYYVYDNVAVVNLNSNYWYTPSPKKVLTNGGNIHGYVMDNQLKWLKGTLNALESDKNIDHIFVTIHTPFFPNSAHISDDMWYDGNNDIRPWVSGKKVDKGIIERRDQLLDLMINKSSKVVAMLTGDEHNYCKTEIGPNTSIYPNAYDNKKIKLKRTVYQINNGAAGAPYYAQREVPWTPFTTGFTTQNAVCFFTVEGENVKMEVVNPDTLEKIDELNFNE